MQNKQGKCYGQMDQWSDKAGDYVKCPQLNMQTLIISRVHPLCPSAGWSVTLYFFSCMLCDSTPLFVGPSVGPSVCWFVTLHFFGGLEVFYLTAPAQMIW